MNLRENYISGKKKKDKEDKNLDFCILFIEINAYLDISFLSRDTNKWFLVLYCICALLLFNTVDNTTRLIEKLESNLKLL